MGPGAQNWKSGPHIFRFGFRGSSAVAPRHFGILGSCPLGGILQALGRTIVLLLSLYVFAFAVVTAVGLPRWSSAELPRFFRGSSAVR